MLIDYASRGGKLSSEQPIAALRWRNGVLQQSWLILEYEGGEPSRQRVEWRDVPTVTE